MRRGHRRFPLRPPLARLQRLVDPLRQVRRPRQRRGHRLRHQLLRDARRQRIDRLKSGQFARLLRPQNMVGMYHLRDTVENLHPTRDEPPMPGRQQLLQKIATRMKEHQLKLDLRIAHHNAVGPTLAAWRKMRANLHLDRHHRWRHHFANRGLPCPVNTGMRQRKQQIARALDPQPREIISGFRADALQRLQIREQRKQDLWPPRHLRPLRSGRSRHPRLSPQPPIPPPWSLSTPRPVPPPKYPSWPKPSPQP
ncbi:hypothetical protein GALL_527680 [mine drainage metagenome]|uniref:Uncharacterized protein n=1 Tax=mine drainage metagenome TaxID=410659 RepID=A0A1J5P3D5_9ZZZZ